MTCENIGAKKSIKICIINKKNGGGGGVTQEAGVGELRLKNMGDCGLKNVGGG